MSMSNGARSALVASLVLLSVPLSTALLPTPALAAADAGTAVDKLLEGPPLELPAADLLAVKAPNAPDGLDVEVLVDDTTFRYDGPLQKDGTGARLTRTFRTVYRVRTEQGVADWAAVVADYHPFHQNKPEIRARVVTADGKVHELDPRTLVDTAAPSAFEAYSDRRRLSGPLPAVAVGCVIETVVTVAEHKPVFEAGSVVRYSFYASSYTARMRVRAIAPKSLKLSSGVWGGPRQPERKTVGTDEILTLTDKDVLPFATYPAETDPALALVPTLEFATGRDWATVAQAYARAVDQQLAGLDAKALVAKLVRPDDPPEARVRKLLAHVHDKVRYTALELGERSWIPNPAADTLARHYGDCKDKATLLVGLLRAAGLEAHVALLRTGPGLDVHATTAGVGLFDHAIVRVDGKALGRKEAVWIDATQTDLLPGILPTVAQDRWVLVAAAPTTALEKTPRLDPAQAKHLEDITIEFPELGLARVKEVASGTGVVDGQLRSSYARPSEPLAKQFESYVRNRYGGKVAKVQVAHADQLDEPLVVTTEVEEAKNFELFDDGGNFSVGANGLYTRLPSVLYQRQEKKEPPLDPRMRKPPEVPVYLAQPHQATIRFHLVVPAGFRWLQPPPELEDSAHGLSVARRAKLLDPRRLELEFVLVAGARLLGAAEQERVRKMLQDFDDESSVQLQFVSEVAAALAEDDVVTALRVDRELLARAPDSVPVRSRAARNLALMGFGVSARALAERLVADHPKSARAHWTLGWVLLFDELGREGEPGCDRARSEDELRKAYALEPEVRQYLLTLALHVASRAADVYPVDVKRRKEAVALYEKLRTTFQDNGEDMRLAMEYLALGQPRKTLEVTQGLEAATQRDGILVAAVAMLDGPEAAVRKAQQLQRDKAKNLLGAAVGALALAGRYEPLAKLVKHRLLAEDSPVLVRLFGRADQAATCRSQLHPAAQAVAKWLGEMVQLPFGQTVFQALSAPNQPEIDANGLAASYRRVMDHLNLFGAAAGRIGLGVCADIAPCALHWQVEELAGAVQVDVHPAGATTDLLARFYLRKVGTGYRLVGGDGGAGLITGLAAALREGNLAQARAWTEWFYAMTDKQASQPGTYGFKEVAQALQPKEVAQVTAEQMGLLVATFQPPSSTASQRMAQLQAARQKPGQSPDVVRALSYAFAYAALWAQQPSIAVPVLTELQAAYPKDPGLQLLVLQAHSRAKTDGPLEAFARTLLAADPEDRRAIDYLNRIDARRGRYAEVLERTLQRLSARKATAFELNNVAWAALLAPKADLGKAMRAAEGACDPMESADWSHVHTLATLQAETGDLRKAHLTFRVMLSKAGSGALDDSIWYTWGRVAEVAGLADAARAAYLRVPRPEAGESADEWTLAQRRLAGLK